MQSKLFVYFCPNEYANILLYLKEFVQNIVSQRFVTLVEKLIDTAIVSSWADLAQKIDFS